MTTLMSYIYYVYFFISGTISLAFAGLVCLVTAPFDPLRRCVHTVVSYWAFHYVQINPFWKCKIEGAENIDPKRAYVLVANHQSMADINVLYGIHRPFKWISKAELFNLPVVGWNLRLNQCIPLKRGDRASIEQMIAKCHSWLKRGASLLIFPEGTRSEDGVLKPFKDGAFRFAIDCDVPVVPIVVNGTRDIITKSGRTLNFKADISVKVLPAVFPKDFNDDLTALRDYVHDIMQKALDEIREDQAVQPAIS